MFQKRIGFQLSGRFVDPLIKDEEEDQDKDLLYQIQIFPEESFTTAQIISLSGATIKHIHVELSSAMRGKSYEKIFALFFMSDLKPFVIHQGYEKLGNRKLLVEFDPSYANSAYVTILLQGSCNGLGYHIQIDPTEIGRSSGQILEKAAERNIEANIKLGEIEHLDEKLIRKILLHLKVHNHEVKIEGSTIDFILGSFLSRLLHSLSSASINRSVKLKGIQKVDQESPDFQALDDSIVTNCALLERLKNVFDHFQIMHLYMEMKRTRGEESAIPMLSIDPLQWDQLPKMVTLLTNVLREAINQESDLWILCQQLELLIALLHAMAILGVDQVDHLVYEEAYATILYFAEEPQSLGRHFIIDYLGQLGKQALFLLPDRAFRIPAQGCTLNLLIRALATPIDEDKRKEPWNLASRLVLKEEIGSLSRWGKGEGRWLVDLCAVQRMIWDPSPQVFLNFVEAIQSNLQAVLREMDLHNPYFVYSLAVFLWKVVTMNEFQEFDLIVRHNATKLLKMISLNNAKEDSTLPFNLGSENLRQELLNTMEIFLGCWDNRIRTKIFVKKSSFWNKAFF